jgi:hypothetical protein
MFMIYAGETGAARTDQKVDSVFPAVYGVRPNADTSGTSPTNRAEREAEVKRFLCMSAARSRQGAQQDSGHDERTVRQLLFPQHGAMDSPRCRSTGSRPLQVEHSEL